MTATLISEATRLAKTDWEKQFTVDQAARLEKWGDDLNLSEKQRAVLEKIVAAGQAEVPA